MEAAPTQRSDSSQTYRPQNKWTSISFIDAEDEELENSKTGKSEEKTIYEVQQGREPFDMNLCSTSIDGDLDNDILQQRLHGVAGQRGELQQMEIELQAQIIARSEIFDMQNKYEAQIKEHGNSVIELQDDRSGIVFWELEALWSELELDHYSLDFIFPEQLGTIPARSDLSRECCYRRASIYGVGLAEKDHQLCDLTQHILSDWMNKSFLFME